MAIKNVATSAVLGLLFVSLVAIYLLICAAMIAGTIFSFVPRCREFDRQMAEMRQEMDRIEQGWEELRP